MNESVAIDTPIIAVSLNYRLHCWGYMWSEEIKNEGVGNLGFRDQRLALHWIQESMRLPLPYLQTLPAHDQQILLRLVEIPAESPSGGKALVETALAPN